jgi:predicted phosphodiesterase
MRLALISDIHGNLISLEAVLADIERQQVDRVVCLGDVAALGPQPREVVARLRALGYPCITGNHDADLFDLDAPSDPHPWVVAATRWCAGLLSAEDLEYVRAFLPLLEIPLGAGVQLCCYHGSPRSNEERILATTPVDELDEMLAGHPATVMVGGHNHVQMLRRHRTQYVVDVGSVGSPLEQMPFRGGPFYMPWAEYAIVGCTDGVLNVDLRRVTVDLEAIKQAAWQSDMPDVPSWVGCWRTPTS